MERLTGRLEVKVKPLGSGGAQLITFVGQIDEATDLIGVVGELREGDAELTLDLERVTCINSLGVREWIRLLMHLRDAGVRVTLERCSEVMVHQMSMIRETMVNVRVESVLAPYHCVGCHQDQMVCVIVAEHWDVLLEGQAPDLACPRCGAVLEFLDVSPRYFHFVQQLLVARAVPSLEGSDRS
jgi:anti-anti-sigma regulatory factor